MPKKRTRLAPPPGSTIKERLEARGMSQREFAARMDYSEKHVCQLIKGDVQLTRDAATRLEMVLGTPARFWNNLESAYREKLQAVRALDGLDDDRAVAQTFPYAEMARLDWVPPARTLAEQTMNLRKFFEVVRLTLLSEQRLYPRTFCQRPDLDPSAPPALLAWLQQAKREARRTPTDRINTVKLYDSLPQIRALAQPGAPANEGAAASLSRLAAVLATCGVALVLVPQLEGNPLHAATFRNGPRIVLAMAPGDPSADAFWPDALHEIGHIALHHDRHPDEGARNEEEATTFVRCMLGLEKADWERVLDCPSACEPMRHAS